MNRFLKANNGSMAVEFALMFPILTLMLIGVAQFSFVLYTNASIQTAARVVTRQVAVNFTEPADAAAAIASRLPAWASSFVTVSINESNPADPNLNEITLQADLMAGHASPLTLLNSLTGDITLTARVVMKQEEVL